LSRTLASPSPACGISGIEPGESAWRGREELITIFMTQLMPSTTYTIRRELRTLVYSAFTESNR